MLKHTITYTDFNGNQKQRELYFNISSSELAIREVESDSTFSKTLQKIGQSNKGSVVLPEFRKLLKWGYGEISEDGESFVKSDALWEGFEKTAAYDALILQLITNAGFASDFMKKMLPADVQARMNEQQAVPGFRPGADTSRPTPPVAGTPTPPTEAPVQQPVQLPTPDQWPIPYQGQPQSPDQGIQHTSEPRQSPFDGPNQQ